MHFRFAVLATACLALSSCTGLGDTKAVDAAVAQFHQKLDAGEFDAIYDAASPECRKATPKDHFVALLSAVHRKLGTSKSVSQQGWSVFSGTNGTTTRATYATEYERGKASESFAFQTVGDRQILLGYNINSDALVIG